MPVPGSERKCWGTILKGRKRSCYDCIAYNFQQDANICALGFRVDDYVACENDRWYSVAEPVDNACSGIEQPQTEEELWNLCEEMGIKFE